MDCNTIAQSLDWANDKLAGGDSPQLDAKLLLAHVLGQSTTYLFTWPEKTLSATEFNAFSDLIERRQHGEPIAYILGYQDFWTLHLKVSTATLIPRPETELLVEIALSKLNSSAKVCDLGTGTGAIALAIASERPDCHVLGLDRIGEAVELAKENAIANRVTNVSFIASDWFSRVENTQFDLIVSNPPYVEADSPFLQEGDVRFEPDSALIADNQGIADIDKITTTTAAYLKAGGWLMFEHGFEQGAAVRNLLLINGYEHIETFKDLNGLDRVTIGQRKACE